MRMKDFWRLSLGCPVRRCDSGFIFDTLQLRKGHRGSSLCVQLCPLAPALGLEQPVHSRLWRGCGQRLDSPGWSHSPHTCIPSRLLHSQVSLSQALGRGLQAPLPKPPYGRGGKETLETSFSTVSTQCFSTLSSPRPPHSPPPPQVHKTAGAFYSNSLNYQMPTPTSALICQTLHQDPLQGGRTAEGLHFLWLSLPLMQPLHTPLYFILAP